MRILIVLFAVGLGAFVCGALSIHLLWMNPIFDGTGKAGFGLILFLWKMSIVIGGSIAGFIAHKLLPRRKPISHETIEMRAINNPPETSNSP